MRLNVICVVVFLCVWSTSDVGECQLTFGTNGLRMPPINLLTVYKILRRTWKMLIKSRKSENENETENNATEKGKQSSGESDLSKAVPENTQNKIKFSCAKSKKGCNELSLKELVEQMTISKSVEKSKITSSDSTNASLGAAESDDLIELPNSPEKRTEESSVIQVSRTPSLLPFPFNTGGWIATYIALNGVLLGLYIFLAAPYFLTGKTVNTIVTSEELYGDHEGYNEMESMEEMINGYGKENGMEDMEDTNEETSESNATMDTEENKSEEYLGYTTYGKFDTLRSTAKKKEKGSKKQEEKPKKKSNKKTEENKESTDSGYLGYTTYGEHDMLMNFAMSDDEDEEDPKEPSGSHSIEVEEEETKCLQNVLCLRPVYGARALMSTSLVFDVLHWMTGYDFFGSKFKRNKGRLEQAVAQGRMSNCHRYICPENARKRR